MNLDPANGKISEKLQKNTGRPTYLFEPLKFQQFKLSDIIIIGVFDSLARLPMLNLKVWIFTFFWAFFTHWTEYLAVNTK